MADKPKFSWNADKEEKVAPKSKFSWNEKKPSTPTEKQAPKPLPKMTPAEKKVYAMELGLIPKEPLPIPKQTTKTMTVGKGKKVTVTPQGKVADKNLVRPDNPFAPFMVNALNTASLGLLERNTNAIDQLREKAPISSTLGSMAGYLAPFSAVKGAVVKGTQTIGKRIATDALIGAGIDTTTEIIKNKNDLGTATKNVALGALFGIAADGALEGLGMLGKTIAKKIKAGEVLSRVEMSAIDTLPEQAKKEIVSAIKKPKANKYSTMTKTIGEPQMLRIKKPIEAPKPISNINTQPIIKSGLKQNVGADKTSKLFSNTYTNADTDVISKGAQKALDESKFIYEGQHNTEQLFRAETRLNANGIDAEMERLSNSPNISGDDTMTHYLITKELTEEAIRTKDTLKVVQWLEDSRPKYTSAGQGIQALSQFKKMTPEGAVNMAVNEVGKIKDAIKKANPKSFNKALEEIKLLPKDANYETAKIKILDKHKIPSLSNDETNFIIDTMTKAQGMADSDAKNILVAKVRQMLVDKNPSTVVDKIRAARNVSLLGNTKTFIRNITGNALLGTLDNTSNTVGATLLRPLDNYMSKMTGFKSVAIPSLKVQGKGAVKGFNNAISDSLGGLTKADLKGKTLKAQADMIKKGLINPIDTSHLELNKFETGHKLAFKNKPMRILENIVNTSLKIGDRPFSQAYYDDVINQLKKANKTDTITDEMKKVAETVAAQRTYQDTNSVSQMMQGIKQLPQKIQNHPQLVNVIQVFVDSLMPYVKTPANILKRGIEYTPVGVLEGILKLGVNVNKGTLTLLEQRKIIDVISRGIVGTGVIGAGVLAGKLDLATGAANPDKDVAALEKNAGKLPNSIKVGKKYIDYSFAQPASTPFSAGVQMVKGKNGLTSSIGEGMSNALNFYADMPMLQSAQRLMGTGFNDKPIGDRVIEAGLNLPTQFIPTALKQVAQLTDKNTRNAYNSNKFKNTANAIQSRIPGLSKGLEPKIDTLGREVLNYQGKNNIFNVALNPSNTGTFKPTEAEKLVLEIFDKTGLKTHFPRVAPTKDVNGKTLDAKLQTALQREMGTRTLAYLNSLASNSNVDSMTEAQLENLVKRIEGKLTDIQAAAKIKILPKELRVKAKK